MNRFDVLEIVSVSVVASCALLVLLAYVLQVLVFMVGLL